MRVTVVGAGGVGGYFGGRLALAGNDVVLVARGSHLAAIRGGGCGFTASKALHRDCTGGRRPGGIGPSEVVLFCVSLRHRVRGRTTGPLLLEDTAVVSLQNGVDNGEIRRRSGPITSSVVPRSSSPPSPRRASSLTGGPARLAFGELDGARTERVQDFS